MNQDMAKVIAKWWADSLREDKHNEEQNSYPGLMLLRDTLRRDDLYLDKVDVFEHELARLLIEGPDEYTHQYGLYGYPENFRLEVDYDPHNFLDRALQLADLPCILPYKTTMLINEDTAVVNMQNNNSIIVWPLDTAEQKV